jgi:hypothetical protein
MNLYRRAPYLALITVLLLTTGCVFVRMMRVKSQLNDFEKNFDLNDSRGLTLVFKNPELHSNDIVWLMKGEPSEKKKIEQGELWTYVFEKEYLASMDDEGDYNIPVLMVMENGQLAEISFPERFLKNLSIPLLKKMFVSMGDAEISKLRKSASSKFKGEDASEIPTAENVVETLGKPYSIENSGEKSEYSYIYYLRKPEGEKGKKNFKFAMDFTVSNEDKSLLQAKGNIRGIKMSLDFDTVKK